MSDLERLESDLHDADRPVVAWRMNVEDHAAEVPPHQHRKGQLVVALHGAVTCQVAEALWIVPPNCGVWIPGGMLHSNLATLNAQLCYLFVEPYTADLPAQCCTLSISPMVREMILHLASAASDYAPGGRTDRLAQVLVEELATAPTERLHLPVSDHPKLQRIIAGLSVDPGDRRTMREWASALAMSERSLARLIVEQTGLTFGHWRRQLQLLVAIRELAAGASVQRVSDDLGYDSVTAFITMFKKALGQPPARYLARLQSQAAMQPT